MPQNRGRNTRQKAYDDDDDYIDDPDDDDQYYDDDDDQDDYDDYDDDNYDDDDQDDQNAQDRGQAPQLDSAQYDEQNNPIVRVEILDKDMRSLIKFKMAQPEYVSLIESVFIPAMSNLYDQNGNKIDNVIVFTAYAGVTYSGQDIPTPSLDIKEVATDYDTVYIKSSSIYKIVEDKGVW